MEFKPETVDFLPARIAALCDPRRGEYAKDAALALGVDVVTIVRWTGSSQTISSATGRRWVPQHQLLGIRAHGDQTATMIVYVLDLEGLLRALGPERRALVGGLLEREWALRTLREDRHT